MSDDRDATPSRRDLIGAGSVAGLAALTPGAAAAGQTTDPGILQYLPGIEEAAAQLTDTWRPNDPAYRADFYRQVMQNLSFAYFIYFHADAEHPDWTPLYNIVHADQPNPDDIYLYAPIRGDLTYRISGNRGTTRLLTFNTMKNYAGIVDAMDKITNKMDYDDRGMTVGPNGELEVIFSARKPEGYTGNWCQIDPAATVLVMRCRMVDWVKEHDPQLSIECLDPVPLKRRLTEAESYQRIQEMAQFASNKARIFLKIQNDLKARVGINTFEHTKYSAGLSRQIYWPAVFEYKPDEALIIETEMPKVRPYWNIQINDPYFNAVEYVYRLSSFNESTAHLSSDGKLRAVLALKDPGVPNWLDTAEYTEGTIYGRWYACDTNPMPTIKRVPLADLRKHLPPDTPVITPAQRQEQLQTRIRAAQRRRRW